MFWKVDAISSKTSDGELYNKRDNNERRVSLTVRHADHREASHTILPTFNNIQNNKTPVIIYFLKIEQIIEYLKK